jgi:peptide/nickel transport system permease protein
LVAAWAAITLNFFIPRLMPGDHASTMFARFQGQLDAEALGALKAAFGFVEDGNLFTQYLSYISHLFRGDLGISIAHFPTPVSSVIGTGLVWTVGLTGMSVLISFALGTILGMFAAWKRQGWLDSLLPPVLTFLGAFPYFWLAMAALFIFGFELGFFPLAHAYGSDAVPGWNWIFLSDVVRHGFLPALTNVIAGVGGWVLSMRNTMVSELGAEYISMARAKGLAPKRVMLRYAARNALLPNVTGLGMALGFVLSGSLFTEMVFSYPGQGFLLVQAVRSQDYPLMQGLFLIITLAVLGANWLVDIVYLWLDPRTRE